MNKTRDRVMWLLIGAAVGAGVALLYAPQSGKQTRRFIAKKTEKGKEAIADTSRDLMEKGRELLERSRKMADEAADLLDRGRRAMGVGA